MPLFRIDNKNVAEIPSQDFALERDLQEIFEANLEKIFGCRFVASEFATGERHGGRIDTLALSEDNNPVIIEYKKVASSDLINQSLFYLSWIRDHRGDFEVAAMRQLGPTSDVDWGDVRVICVAPQFKKYDLHAVGMMGANIELWQYHYFEDGTLYLEEVYRQSGERKRSTSRVTTTGASKADDDDAKSEAPSYSLEMHMDTARKNGVESLYAEFRDYLLNLDNDIEEAPKKFYVAYKVAKNFVCVEFKKKTMRLFLKVDPKAIAVPAYGRDVTNIGHYGTGELELNIQTADQLEESKALVERALKNVGG